MMVDQSIRKGKAKGMASIDFDKSAPSSEPKTPTQCATPRPRSDTTIPYVPAFEVEDDDQSMTPRNAKHEEAGQKDVQVLSPVPRLLSPFPDFSPEEALSVELENERMKLIAPPPPVRANSPLPGHPFITDASSLLTATLQNPDRIFNAIKNMVNERDALKADLARTNTELQSVTEDLANTRIDHKTARHRYEELFRVASAKQVILWKYIESLHSQMAFLRGQPDPNIGAGHGLGLHMSVRGGPGMGVAMEKWISEGMDSDKGSRIGEEGSEKGTEQSFWSADDSFGNKNLDPSAQTFIPQIGSPQKFRRRSPGSASTGRSPNNNNDHQMPPTPSTYTSYAVQDPGRAQPQLQYSSQPMGFAVTPQHSTLPPHSLLAPLPPRWYGICPHSLADTTPCPLGANCKFVPLCALYNHPAGDGCPDFKKEGPSACRYAHEYRFCEDEISYPPGRCLWERHSSNYLAARERTKKAKALHVRLRAHRANITKSEWDARMVLLSMREAHARGIFNGQQLTRGRTMY
ncbi:hypothetical protein VTL71DRAFT_1401 [Oculimacula yallundae]|uniref:C3H1-type domain-containing protein n=1 Tax=Oculimacula yallundae TaxID=86028 RepID=A0ABR4CBR9_9HELO